MRLQISQKLEFSRMLKTKVFGFLSSVHSSNNRNDKQKLIKIVEFGKN